MAASLASHAALFTRDLLAFSLPPPLIPSVAFTLLRDGLRFTATVGCERAAYADLLA